jgi:uncharacterized membrane protein YhhN
MTSPHACLLIDAVAMLLAILVCRDARRTRHMRWPVAIYGGLLSVLVSLLDARVPKGVSLGWPLLGALCYLSYAGLTRRKRAGA